MINSWKHLGFFIVLFLFIPVGIFILLKWLAKSYARVAKIEKGLVSFFSLLIFFSFIQICLYAKIQWWLTGISLLLAVIFAVYLSHHFRKLFVFQLLLAFVGLFSLVPRLYSQLTYSEEWLVQPDNIETATFKKKPNVYFIQPDGYVNFSEISKGYYEFDNNSFKDFLKESGFVLYDDFRSNYTSTLASNTAIFVMKHHYYNNGFNFSEITNAREIIITKNAVLDVFKNNGYKTHFLAEWPYLVSNFPKLGYDESNFAYDDVSMISEGFDEKKQVFPYLKEYMEMDTETPKFFFMEILDPGHVTSREEQSEGSEEEKKEYWNKLERANEKLVEIIRYIHEVDPEGLIVIMADHGGFVGYNYTGEIYEKSDDRDLLYSAFSAQLAIKWPKNISPEYDRLFKSNINTFRILFAYLSEEEAFLDHLQEDASYTKIKKGAIKGIYEVIDGEGIIVFRKK